MRITVADSISPSYFVAIAAVELGFFREEGVDLSLHGTAPLSGLARRRRPVRVVPVHLLVPGGSLRHHMRTRRRQCGEGTAPERVGLAWPDDETGSRGSRHRPPVR